MDLSAWIVLNAARGCRSVTFKNKMSHREMPNFVTPVVFRLLVYCKMAIVEVNDLFRRNLRDLSNFNDDICLGLKQF
jgi:hypothetical protein